MPQDKQHAAVIGGSMAGLLAGRVLADHFEHVTIIERDRLPTGPEPRKGLPQARHVHVLLWRGQQCLEKLFPGLQDELEQAGAPQVDWTGDSGWYSFGGWAPRFRSRYVSHPCSRDLLEWTIRRRLSSNPQVQFLEESEAADLLTTSDKSRVTGIRLRHRHQPDQGAQELQADLVVDASGRESHIPRWLKGLGYESPQETVVNSFLGYASRIYQKPPTWQSDWVSLLVRSTPPLSSRGGVINPIEHGRWMVTLGAAGRDYPPTDEAGFLEFARSLPVPTLYDAIKDAQPLTPIYGYRKTENRWRHFERLARWPENLIVAGDAVCAFNPVYGQGMTVAALGALTLADCLNDRRAGNDLAGLAKRFHTKLAQVIAGPWLLATGDDFRYPETEGGRPGVMTRLMHRYVDQVMYTANENAPVFLAFFEVAQLLKPPTVLFQPHIAARVMARIIWHPLNVAPS
jgi:2-polyprenyl-6-methoxyphenol hydroxylase-like FAD-dependent oxidoreductase